MKEARYFFSYAREDSDFVLRLAKELRVAGANLWLDQLDIVGGQHWDRAIEAALRACTGMIIVLSPNSVVSDNVMDEVAYALEQRKLVVPVLYQDCDFPFRLRRVQYIDFTQSFESGCTQLLRALDIPLLQRTESALPDGSVSADHYRQPATTPRTVPISKREPALIDTAESEKGSASEAVTRYPIVSPSLSGRGVMSSEGFEKKMLGYMRKLRPLAMHLAMGFGLLAFNSRLLRGWLYPCAFVYFIFVGGVCIGGVAVFRDFCQTDFSFISFGLGIALYVLGFIDIALGIRFRALGRRSSFWD